MVVTHIEGSGSGARVYVVNFFFSVMVSSKQEMIMIIQGDGPEDLEQHPHGLLADSLAEHHGPRHCLLQALLLRGHHHRQPHCHAGAHYYVSCPI